MSPPGHAADRRVLDAVAAILEEFWQKDRHIRADAVMIFLWVAASPRGFMRMKDIEKLFGAWSSTNSRRVRVLADEHWEDDPDTGQKRPGLGLIETVADPDDRRGKIVKLTEAGRRLSDKIVARLNVGGLQ